MAEHGSQSASAKGHGLFSEPKRSLCNIMQNEARKVAQRLFFYYTTGGWTVAPFIILVADAVVRSFQDAERHPAVQN
jgi:hypothetical protein